MSAQQSIRFFAPIVLLACLAAFRPATSAHAQTTIDEGAFRLLVDGREIGSENFWIRQTGSGSNAVTVSLARIVVDTANSPQQIEATLRLAGPSFRPSEYQLTAQGGDLEQLAGRLIGRRFSSRVVSSAGERMREYIAGDDAVLVDDGILHHNYFLVRLLNGGDLRLPVIVPRAGEQVDASVSVRGPDAIDVDGRRVDARRILVRVGDGPDRHVWADRQGRLLRVEIPARRLVAERTALP